MINSFEEYILTISYAPFVAIVFMLIYLHINSRMEGECKRLFNWLLTTELLELVAYDLELYTARLDHPTFLRVFLSVIGYCTRPILIYVIMLLAFRLPFRTKKASIYFIPILINGCISFTGFFSGIAFSYTAENEFVRGPLGYTSQIVLFAYFFWILFVSFARQSQKSKLELVIVVSSVVICAGSVIVEALYSVRSFGQTSLAMATIFYFMYFQTNEFDVKIEQTTTLNQALKVASQTDPLTGLLNKTSFIETMDESLKEQNAASKVLFFFDLDNFKGYNDTLGHLAGDELLKKVGDRLKEVFRDTDEIGRFGGDEFYIFMQDIPYEAVAERAEQLLGKMQFSEEDKAIVTASIGIIYHAGGQEISSTELLRHADIALYDAKNQGKNRYVVNTL